MVCLQKHVQLEYKQLKQATNKKLHNGIGWHSKLTVQAKKRCMLYDYVMKYRNLLGHKNLV